ncbi:hypothetical protein BIBE0010001c01_00042 [Bifidobacterium phage BigBern1]|nr:hypothetical protein BIBE0010001c01_00042 [Bifidobacterium phage BigBern1]
MQHPLIAPQSQGEQLAALAAGALDMASRQQTGNIGSVTIPTAGGTKLIAGEAAGLQGIAPWVGDTTPPGMPTGVSVDSAAGMILVTWDGTLQGGIPADFDHVQVLVDGTEAGQLRVQGTVPLGPYEADSVHQVTVRAWDDAHAEDGSPAPNGSDTTAPISVTVKSVAGADEIQAAQDKAQKAINEVAGVKQTAASASQAAADAGKAAADAGRKASQAKVIADGKNRVIAAASEPAHDGLALGDLWMQLDQANNVTGIQLWNGKEFVDYVLMAQQVLVAGSVGTICLADGAVVADKVTASEALLEKLLVRKIKADEIDVGMLTAAIVRSGLFSTPDGLVGIDSSGFWAKGRDGKYLFRASGDGVQAVGGFQTASSGDRIQLSQTLIQGTTLGGLQGIGDDPTHPYWLIWGDHDGLSSKLFMGTTTQQPEIAVDHDNNGENSVALTANHIAINSTTINGSIRVNSEFYTPHINVPLDQWIDFYSGFSNYVNRTRLDIAGGMCYMTVAVQGSLPDNQYTQVAHIRKVYPHAGMNVVCTMQYAYAAGAFIGSDTDPDPQVINVMNHSGGTRTWAVAQFIFPYEGQLN